MSEIVSVSTAAAEDIQLSRLHVIDITCAPQLKPPQCLPTPSSPMPPTSPSLSTSSCGVMPPLLSSFSTSTSFQGLLSNTSCSISGSDGARTEENADNAADTSADAAPRRSVLRPSHQLSILEVLLRF